MPRDLYAQFPPDLVESAIFVVPTFPAQSLLRTLVVLLLAGPAVMSGAPLQIRVATFNTSLNRTTQGGLVTSLTGKTDAQAKRVAEIIQRVRPDILLVNEFDFDGNGNALRLFHDNYLAVSQNGQAALSYPYRYTAPSNTGVTSGFDLDNAGGYVAAPGSSSASKDSYGNDCFGFGWFPGQYGMAVYSKFPIRTEEIRIFRLFLWKDMPGAALPDQAGTSAPQDWYSAGALAVLRLSSKSHWDLPIEVVPGQIIHLLASHPTPPAFDTAEDRNGHRNHDEIRFWADYVSNATYVYDDAGVHNGLPGDKRFVILGDMNADPLDGDSYQGAVNQLLNHPLINSSVIPTSTGAASVSASQGGVNTSQRGDPKYDTADFFDGSGGAGNLRVDHVLPSKIGLTPLVGGVFWPPSADPLYSLVFPTTNSSDHRMVYLDVDVVPIVSDAVKDLACAVQGNDVVLSWGTQAGITYAVQTAASADGEWIDAPGIAVVPDASAQTASAIDAGAASGAQKLYRVVCRLEAPAGFAGLHMPTGSAVTRAVRRR